MRLLTTTRFERDIKRAGKRGKDLDKLWTAVDALLAGQELAPRYRPHQLSGQWATFRECHLEADWLLIWAYRGDALVLVRTGTHTDLFG